MSIDFKRWLKNPSLYGWGSVAMLLVGANVVPGLVARYGPMANILWSFPAISIGYSISLEEKQRRDALEVLTELQRCPDEDIKRYTTIATRQDLLLIKEVKEKEEFRLYEDVLFGYIAARNNNPVILPEKLKLFLLKQQGN